MPTRHPTWSTLVPGLVALAAVVACIFGVLVFARVGALHGDTYRLYTVTDEANGIMRGSDVWLGGAKVGVVAAIEFRPVATDAHARLRVGLDVLSRYRAYFRANSTAQIRNGGTVMGSPVVYVTPGTPAAPVLPDGATIAGRGQLDTEGFTSQVAMTSHQFPAIIQDARIISAQLNGVVAMLRGPDVGAPRVALRAVGGRAIHFAHRVIAGRGTVGGFLRGGDSLDVRVQRAIAHADSLLRLLDSERGTVGRLRSDTLLLRTVTDTRNELAILRALLAGTQGTAGRAVHDPAIVRQLERLERELAAVVADVKRAPGRYVAF